MSRNNKHFNDDDQNGNNMDMPEELKLFSNSQSQKLSNKEEGQDQKLPEEEMPEEEKFFKDFNNIDIDNNDPSLQDGLIKIYEEEVPFEIRYEEENLAENKKNNFQSLLCKIFMTEENLEPVIIKFELASNKDFFFYYTTEMNSKLFEKIKEGQKLTCDFLSLSDIFIKYFDYCINNPKEYLAILNINNNNKANLVLMENFEFKCAELININFIPASNDLIRKQIIYRYNAMRAMEDIIQNRIHIINGVLKDVDPPLIMEVKNEISKQLIQNEKENSKKKKTGKNNK